MKQKHLKSIRVILALICLISISSLFLDFREIIPTAYHQKVLFFQFLPSLLKFMHVTGFATAGFLLVLILTFMFGRIYCSALCPLGIFQDIFSYLSRKFKLKRKFKYTKAYSIIRYSFIILPFILIPVTGLFLLYLLDPYSNFGRIFSDLFKPLLIGLNNLFAGIFSSINLYFLTPTAIKGFSFGVILFPFILLVVLVWMSLFRGRLFCNTVCPVGTILGMASKVSLYKIKINSSSCTKCGKCMADCKSECIDFKNLYIDFDRCVGCFNCITACELNSINYKLSFASKNKRVKNDHKHTDTSKRSFIAAGIFSGLGLLGLKSQKIFAASANNKNLKPERKNCPVSPPGSKGIHHFKSNCTACHLCVSACPTAVLQPSFLEYGFTGMLQPHMDYHVSYCNYECTKCGEVCPTGAIISLEKETKKLAQIGQVHLTLSNCVVITDETACGSCSEHCPTQAVHMVPYKNGLTKPEINTTICIGCGACEFACPVRPFRAIYVDGNKIHRLAEVPHFEKLKDDKLQEEFPF